MEAENDGQGRTTMTDAEHKNLCERLREIKEARPWLSECGEAADEIERLVKVNKELKKSLHHLHSARETDMGTAE